MWTNSIANHHLTFSCSLYRYIILSSIALSLAFLLFQFSDFFLKHNVNLMSFMPFLEQKSDDFSYHSQFQVKTASVGDCLSLKESKNYYPASYLPPPSPNFLKALRKQEKLQERCTSDFIVWNEHFKSSEKGLENCKYLIWTENGQGLGNRFLSLISAFMYSLLTQRVLLVDVKLDMDRLICNPFPSSSFFLPRAFNVSSQLGLTQAEYMHMDASQNLTQTINFVHLEAHWYSMYNENQHFFCDFLQQRLKDVRWLSFGSEMTLDLYFPNRLIIPYITRYLLLPSNPAWNRIKGVYDAHFKKSKKRLGLQIRSFGNFNENVTKRVISCIMENRVLPLRNQGSMLPSQDGSQEAASTMMAKAPPLEDAKMDEFNFGAKEKKHPDESTNEKNVVDYLLYIASLGNQHYRYFKEHVADYFDTVNSIIVLHKEETMVDEVHSLSQDYIAMVDIWLLSMTDTLFTSYISTFGYVAKALSANRAYMFNICELYQLSKEDTWTTNNKTACYLSQSPEACFLIAPLNLDCVDRNDFPFVSQCEDAEEGLSIFPL